MTSPPDHPSIPGSRRKLYWFINRTVALSKKGTVELADFANSTGDPVFDDALKQLGDG